MNDDYLWDKSGEPDPEIQQLEQILGTLRYQPRPFEIPDDVVVHRRRNYFPLMAIAATLIIALLAAGLWWRATIEKKPVQHEVIVTPPVPSPGANKEPDSGTTAVKHDGPKPQPIIHRHNRQPQNALAKNNKQRPNSTAPALTTAQEKEAEEAKAQLLMALRLASEKLNLVQRKTQGGTAPNQIRNQHKIG